MKLQKKILRKYRNIFGHTTRFNRLADIKEEAKELFSYRDEDNLIEELSDLICTCLALAEEEHISLKKLVKMNLKKLKHRHRSGHYKKTGESK